MGISNEHNLAAPPPADRPYGIRVSLRPGDPFRKLLGEDWQRLHWYASAAARDAALVEMSRRHDYSRSLDAPALDFARIDQAASTRAA